MSIYLIIKTPDGVQLSAAYPYPGSVPDIEGGANQDREDEGSEHPPTLSSPRSTQQSEDQQQSTARLSEGNSGYDYRQLERGPQSPVLAGTYHPDFQSLPTSGSVQRETSPTPVRQEVRTSAHHEPLPNPGTDISLPPDSTYNTHTGTTPANPSSQGQGPLHYIPSRFAPLDKTTTLTEYIEQGEKRLRDTIYHLATLGDDVWESAALRLLDDGHFDTYQVQPFEASYYEGDDIELYKERFRNFDKMRRTFARRITIYGKNTSRPTFVDTVEYTSADFPNVRELTWLLHRGNRKTEDFLNSRIVNLAVSSSTRVTTAVIEGKGYKGDTMPVNLEKTCGAIENALTSLLTAQGSDLSVDTRDGGVRLSTIRVKGCPGRVLTILSLSLGNGIFTEIYPPRSVQSQGTAYGKMISEWMKSSKPDVMTDNRILFKLPPPSNKTRRHMQVQLSAKDDSIESYISNLESERREPYSESEKQNLREQLENQISFEWTSQGTE